MPKLTDRQNLLLEWLQTQGSASIEEIQGHFSISPATAYRDVRAVVESGLALKTSNGVRSGPPAEPCPPGEKCAFCGGTVNERTAFVVLLHDGGQRTACCPHCGMLALGQLEVSAALACDFLYGRMINARQAVFLVSSSVNLCCEPSVLCFATPDQARRFQLGFGGQLCDLDQAAVRVKEIMAIQFNHRGTEDTEVKKI
jgi:hypothetical protein